MENSIITGRLVNLREKLREKGMDAALVTKRENCIYLSGFTGDDTYLIITGSEAVLLTDFRYVEQAQMQSPLYNVIEYKGSMLVALDEILRARGIEKLGFEEENMSYAKYDQYNSKLSAKELIPMGGMIEKLRIVKDTEEIEIIKKAQEIADKTFSHILGFIKPGVTELELSAEMEYHMKKLGAKGPSFEIIAASGTRSSLPHGAASRKTIETGDTITFDFGALYSEYCSDMTRTVFLGKPADEMVRIYNTVLDAQMKALEGAKRGLLGKEIDAIARDIIYAAGYEGRFGHGLGHGVGLEIHEDPRVSPAGNIRMEDGMVITIEPGIYVPGLGGVRIEDMVVINGDEPVNLTASAKNLIVI